MKFKKILTQKIEDNVLPMGYNQGHMVIRLFEDVASKPPSSL